MQALERFILLIMQNPEFEQKSLANLLVVRNLTERLGGGIKKSFGQNFLINQGSLFRFIDLLKITKEDTIIEIGPGIGVLSYTLCQLAKKVILIELDREKEQALRKVLENYDNYEIIFDDASTFDFATLQSEENIKVIGSLPYNVAKRIIYNLLNSGLNWQKAAFILQKEVAENYTSLPPKAEFLSTFARIYSDPELRFQIPNKHFYPIPKVTSATILLQKKDTIVENPQAFSKFIKAGYSSPRKTILNNLKSLGITKESLESIGIKPTSRPSELNVFDWKKIFESIQKA